MRLIRQWQQRWPYLYELLWIGLACLVWVIAFWPFVSGQEKLSSDAISYYNHTQYMIKSLARGDIPLWDPYWNHGSSNAFFLRRMGSYNPVYFLLVVGQWLQLPFYNTYLIFLTGYFFLGCIGFYGLCRKLFDNALWSYLAFLLLLFSALATRIFDSFIILISTPLMLFFYFLVIFIKKPTAFAFSGLVLTISILLSTYIPFYSFLIIVTFLTLLALIYFHDVGVVTRRVLIFFTHHRWLVLTGLISLILIILPSVNLFLEGQDRQFVMSNRNAKANVNNSLGVSSNLVSEWAILEEFVFSSVFLESLKDFRFAVVYLPFVFYLLLIFLPLSQITRRHFLVISWGGLILLMSMPHLSGFYQWCYDHIVIFKYFRNLHFFLWYLLIPLAIFFVVDCCQLVFMSLKNCSRSYLFFHIVLFLIWVGFWVYFLQKKQVVLLSTQITLIAVMMLAGFLCWAFLKKRLPQLEQGLALIMLAIVSCQPLQVYTYLADYVEDRPADWQYPYDRYEFEPHLLRDRHQAMTMEQRQETRTQILKPRSFHYASAGIQELYLHIPRQLLRHYKQFRFWLYDEVVVADDKELIPLVNQHLVTESNRAYIHNTDLPVGSIRSSGVINPSPQAYSVQPAGKILLKELAANKIHLETRLNEPKFLVYTDAFHPDWSADINGMNVPLFETNRAFKGVWLPEGNHKVTMRFGRWQDYFLNVLNMLLCYGWLIFCVVMSKRSREVS